ncbi:MAG TPA: MBL fold metallo-hydrolase [Methylibium sp.]
MSAQSTPHDYLQPLDCGITVIDTGFVRPRFDAAYLIVEQGRAAYVDTGTNDALPRLLGALDAQGLSPDAVDWLIVTHVHLDHAGAAGALMRHLPRARLVVHPRGARHMIDPRMLLDGARAVYGVEEVARTYGEVLPVPAERVLATADDMVLELADRPLRFIDSPGHARHHHCIWDEASRGWFTGDTFGLSYPELETPVGRYILPTSTPVQFEPEALKASIRRMLSAQPQWMYLTHYGRVGAVPQLARLLLTQIDEMVALAKPLARSPARHDELKTAFAGLYLEHLQRMDSPLTHERLRELLATDIELNAQGIGVWLDKPRTA